MGKKIIVLFGYVNSTCQQFPVLLRNDLRAPMPLFGLHQPQSALQNVMQLWDRNFGKQFWHWRLVNTVSHGVQFFSCLYRIFMLYDNKKVKDENAHFGFPFLTWQIRKRFSCIKLKMSVVKMYNDFIKIKSCRIKLAA